MILFTLFLVVSYIVIEQIFSLTLKPVIQYHSFPVYLVALVFVIAVMYGYGHLILLVQDWVL